MADQRLILEMGTGNDLYGGDYTKAACARCTTPCGIHRCRCTGRWGWTRRRCASTSPLACSSPIRWTVQEVARQMPYGQISVKAVKGGLDVPDAARGDKTVIAAAAIEARYDIPEGRFKLIG
jgi:hypothetical protein